MNHTAMKTETLPEELTAFFKLSILSILVLLKLEASQVGFLLCTVFIDSFFGVIKAIRLGESLDSGRFVWGISKKIAILFVPFLLAIVGLVFKINFIYLVQAFIYLIAINDVISIVSNIASIYSGKRYETVDFIEQGIKLIIEWLTNAGNTILKKLNTVITALGKNEDPKNPDQHQKQ